MEDEELPAPLVPDEVDLRDFGFMPLDVLRLRDSDLATVATGDEFKAAVLLWSTSWHQIPSSSVPNDDRWFAKHSGAGPHWRKVKAEALRGFVLCSDGRRYHPVVAEKAAEGWNGKLEAEHKRACDRQRKVNKERADQKMEALPMPPRPHLISVRAVDGFPCWRYWNSDGTQTNSRGNSEGIPSDGLRKSRLKGEVRERESKGRVKGQGEGEGQEPPRSNSVAPTAARRTRREAGNDEAKGAATWEAYRNAYRERHKADPVRNAKVNSLICQFVDRLGVDEAPLVAAFYLQSNRSFYVSRKHPVSLLLTDAEALRTEWFTGRAGTQTEAMQADRTAATGNVFRELIEENRNAGK